MFHKNIKRIHVSMIKLQCMHNIFDVLCNLLTKNSSCSATLFQIFLVLHRTTYKQKRIVILSFIL